jgi:hypothetical protein
MEVSAIKFKLSNIITMQLLKMTFGYMYSLVIFRDKESLSNISESPK